jgi:hypothetical protein
MSKRYDQITQCNQIRRDRDDQITQQSDRDAPVQPALQVQVGRLFTTVHTPLPEHALAGHETIRVKYT